MNDPHNPELPARRPYVGRVLNPMIDADNADHQLLATFLQDRDVHCPLCNYNLRSLKRSICPECGKVIELTVKVPVLSYASWIVLTFALTFSAGIGALFLGAIIDEGLPSGPDADVMNMVIVGHFATIPLAIGTALNRRRFLRLSEGSQQVWAIAGVTASVVLFVMLFVYVIN